MGLADIMKKGAEAVVKNAPELINAGVKMYATVSADTKSGAKEADNGINQDQLKALLAALEAAKGDDAPGTAENVRETNLDAVADILAGMLAQPAAAEDQAEGLEISESGSTTSKAATLGKMGAAAATVVASSHPAVAVTLGLVGAVLSNEEVRAVTDKLMDKGIDFAKEVTGLGTPSNGKLTSKLALANANAQAEIEEERAKKELRQAALENADAHMRYEEFCQRMERLSNNAVFTPGGLFDMPGCFVIAKYAKLDFDNDFTDYKGIYVGAANKLGADIAAACGRQGNPDVYADIKYKQNVQVYCFACDAASVEAKKAVLMGVFAGEELYNI